MSSHIDDDSPLLDAVGSNESADVAGVELFNLCSRHDDPCDLAETSSLPYDDTSSSQSQSLPEPSSLNLEDLPATLGALDYKTLNNGRDYFRYVYLLFGYQITTGGGGEAERRIRLKCSKSGHPISHSDPANVTLNSSSSKCGCKWQVTLTAKADGTVGVSRSNAHVWEHTCLPNPVLKEGGVLSIRQLSGAMIEWITEAGKSSPATLLANMSRKFSLSFVAPHVVSTVLARSRHGKGDTQTQQLLDYLIEHDDSFIHSVEWKKAGKDGGTKVIKNLFIMTPTMRSLFRQYGQFLVVDATYKTNEFGRPLLIFTVRTGTGHYAIVGMCLLEDESAVNP